MVQMMEKIAEKASAFKPRQPPRHSPPNPNHNAPTRQCKPSRPQVLSSFTQARPVSPD